MAVLPRQCRKRSRPWSMNVGKAARNAQPCSGPAWTSPSTGRPRLTLRHQTLYTYRAYADGLVCHAFNSKRRPDQVRYHDEDHRAIPVPASSQCQHTP